MGNNSVKILPERVTFDPKIQKWRDKLHLNETEILKLFNRFHVYEDKNNLVLLDKVYSELMGLDMIVRNPALEAMLSAIDMKHPTAISFGEYIDFICKYCLYSIDDFLLFIFKLFDHKHEDLCYFDEFRAFCFAMFGDSGIYNLEKGLASIIVDRDGKFKYFELEKMNRKYPLVLYPIFSIQVTLMRISWGEYWWEQMLYRLNDEAKLIREKEEGDTKSKERIRAKAERDQLIRKMGWLQYTFMPWERGTARNSIIRAEKMVLDVELRMQLEEEKSKIKPPTVAVVDLDKELSPRVSIPKSYEVQR